MIGYLLEETWTTLDELNEAIADRVHEINHDIRRADGTTRFELFIAEEAPLLSPLPDERFEQVEWKQLKAGRNYHVTADYQHYSVPCALAGRMLRARLTLSRVTVFDGQQVVAEHRRMTGRKGQYSTDPGHVPPQHRNVDGLWSRRWFVDRAAAFGPATVHVIEQILDRHQIEAQGYLDCPTYSTLKRLMAAIDSDQNKPAHVRAAASNRKNTPTPEAGAAGALVRGADYYRQGR